MSLFGHTGFSAKVVADSIGEHGVRLTTLQLRYPRMVHSEFMTHRAFSRNASSSRAIPVAKMIEQVRNEPAMPVHWGKNQPGMQAREELIGDARDQAYIQWLKAANDAADRAEKMMKLGLHKQVANRILEPFQFISVIVTATDWDNFFELRDHKDADPNIKLLAFLMKKAMGESAPVLRKPGGTADAWHLVYITDEERAEFLRDPRLLCKLSAARCARVSYLTHEGTIPTISKDLDLHDKLVGSRPLHASPTEHQAEVMYGYPFPERNFRGWTQYRSVVEAA